MQIASVKLYNGIFKSKYLLKKRAFFSTSVQYLEKCGRGGFRYGGNF